MINIEELEKEAPIWFIGDAEFVQATAEANCGRKLTEKEMKRLQRAFLECLGAQAGLMEAVIAAINDVVDDGDGRWNESETAGAERKR